MRRAVVYSFTASWLLTTLLYVLGCELLPALAPVAQAALGVYEAVATRRAEMAGVAPDDQRAVIARLIAQMADDLAARRVADEAMIARQGAVLTALEYSLRELRTLTPANDAGAPDAAQGDASP